MGGRARNPTAGSAALSNRTGLCRRRSRFRYCPAAFRKPQYGDSVEEAFRGTGAGRSLGRCSGQRPKTALRNGDKIAAVVEATLQTKPVGMTHWSCRTLAEQQGISKSTVNNIWRAHNLQPHRTENLQA